MNGRISQNELGHFKEIGPKSDALRYFELSKMVNLVSRRSNFEGADFIQDQNCN